MTSEFYSLIRSIKSSIELELSKRPLTEKTALRIFMPLTVNLISDFRNASFIFKDCSVSVSTEASQAPDITIYTTFQTLRSLYYSPDKKRFLKAEMEGKVKIVSHTYKGRLAEKKLRESLKG